MEHANERCMFLEPVDDEQVLTLIKQCKNKTSEDYNNISMNIVKNITETVLQPFSFICNLSFSTGSVPNKMKIAKIIPIFKSGNKSLFNNYRPVALLPQFLILRSSFASDWIVLLINVTWFQKISMVLGRPDRHLLLF